MVDTGMRVTDAVNYFRRRNELSGSVQIVRGRTPDRLRWRSAVSTVTHAASELSGRDRQRVEEPVREVVLDLPDVDLRREVVLDARKNGVDLDRGEILPRWSMGDLRRMAFLTSTNLDVIGRYTRLPDDFFAPIDTAAIVLIGRAFSEYHKRRAHKIWLELPDAEDPFGELSEPHRKLAERAADDSERSRRWQALAKTLVAPVLF